MRHDQIELIKQLRAAGDDKSIRIAEYMWDRKKNPKIKAIIIMMIDLTPDELKELNCLVNGNGPN